MALIVFVLTFCAVNHAVHATKNLENLHNNGKGVKEKLDNFTMARKKSFYITPPFEIDNIVAAEDSKKNMQESKVDSNKDDYADAMHFENNDEIPSMKPSTESNKFQTHDNHNNVYDKNRDIKSAQSYDYDLTYIPKEVTSQNENTMDLNKEVLRQFAKQNEMIQKLGNRYQKLMHETQIRNQINRFDAILKAINETKKKRSVRTVKRHGKNDTATSTSVKDENITMVTVMNIIDEAEVKKALRADPYVQRILKMAREKKIQYKKLAQAEVERFKENLRKGKMKHRHASEPVKHKNIHQSKSFLPNSSKPRNVKFHKPMHVKIK